MYILARSALFAILWKGRNLRRSKRVRLQGYRMSKDTNGKESCVPVCTQDCTNGVCVDPDVCHCNKDYYMDINGFTCRASVCSEECEKNNGYCLEPNVCSCRTGYKKTGNDSSSFTCEPECETPCINGHCVAPNICRCMDDYDYDHDSYSSCKPEDNCVYDVHGTCTASGICTCHDGYRAVSATVCEPICSEPCINSICVAPESCSCFEGYRPLENSRYICKPICKVNCGNGTCTAPGVCTCDKGFTYNNQTDPMCQSNCYVYCDMLTRWGPCKIHNLHNNCTCIKEYHFSAMAIKNAGTKSSSTFISNRIKIYRFFQQFPTLFAVNMHIHQVTIIVKVSKEEDAQKYFSELFCQPICDPGCINDTCIALNVCDCHAGFNSLSIRNNTARIYVEKDVPMCDVIECGRNEICDIYGFCSCKHGYRRNEFGNCVSACTLACINGICTAQNRCICNAGYRLRNKYFCEPICEKGCKNGDCVGPNSCVCHDNFVQNTGQRYVDDCIPACTRYCNGHGKCVIDDEYSCKCDFGWTGSDCDQPTMCVISMEWDHSDINRITVRNDSVNSTIILIHKSAPHCYQCNNSLNNESFCYLLPVVHFDGICWYRMVGSTVGCLLDLPCASPYNITNNTVTNNTVTNNTVWPFMVAAVLIVTSVAAIIIYLIYRHRKNKLTENTTVSLAKVYAASESLLSEGTE